MKKIVVLLSLILPFHFLSAQDLSVSFIISPSTACGHTNAEPVTIFIQNNSGIPATVPYTISYQVNGGAIITENVVNPGDNIGVAPSNTKTKVFATTVNMTTPGVYNFKAWVTHPGDVAHANDTAFKTVNSDANTNPGIALQHDTVCSGNNGDTIRLIGNVGTVTGWVANGTPIPSSADSTYVYSNLTQTTAFAAIVRNGTCPFDTSAPAIIRVDSASIAGTITGPAAVCIGSSGSLVLTGSRGNILDWETSQNAGGPWNSASNTTTTLNYNNIQTTDDTLFRTIVRVGVCPADTSPVKTLNLDQPSVGGTVSQSVGNDTVCSGTNSGTLQLSGHLGSVVEWQRSTGGPFASAGSAGSTTFNFTNLTQTTTYRAMVQNGTCAAVPSSTFTITVSAGSVGGVISNNASVCNGTNFGTLTLLGNIGNVIRWDSSTVSGAGPYFPITNTTSTQNYQNLSVTTYYRAVVKNGVCPAIPSAFATITVNSPSVGGTITPAGPTTVCAGNNTDILTVSGINGTIVRWERSLNNGVTWVNTGVTTNTLTYTNLIDTALYRVRVQNGGCPVAYSDTLQIIVLPAAVSGAISGTATVCAGSSANLTLSGHSGSIVKWRVSTNGGASYLDLGGSAGQTNITPGISTTRQFIAIVQIGGCTPDTTNPFVVTATPVSVGGVVGNDTLICSGGAASMTLTGHTGNVVRWEISTNNGASWTNQGSAGATNFVLGPLTDTTMFRAIVQSGGCPTATSSAATATVIPASQGGTVTITPPNDTVCEGNHAVQVSLSGQLGNIVRWESSTGGPFVDEGVSGNPQVFNKTYTANTLFRAVVQNGAGCPTATSPAGTVVVNPTTVGGTISAASTTVCGGSNSGTITLTGRTGAVVRWEQSVNFGPFAPVVPPNTTTTLNYSGLNDTTQYRVLVQSGECASKYSDTALIQIIPAAIGGQVTGAPATPLCITDTTTRTLTLTGSFGTIQRWERSINGVSWTNIGNAGNLTLNYKASSLTQTTYYRVRLQDGACPAVFSIRDTVLINQPSNAGTVNGATSLCATGNSGFVHISGYLGNVLGWLSSTDGVSFSPVPASANDTLFYNNLIDTTYYRAIVQNAPCENDTSAIVAVNVSPDAVGGTLNGSASYCVPVNSTLLQLTGYTGSVVRWQQSVAGGPFTNIAVTVDTLRVNNIVQNTDYRVIISSGPCGNDTSTLASVTVGVTIGGTINTSAMVCDTINGDTLILTGYTGTVVNWQSSTDGVNFNDVVPANITDSLVYENLKDTTYYRVIVQNGACPVDTSDTAMIRVDPPAIGGLLSASTSFCDTVNTDTLILTGYQGNIINWESSVDTGKTWVPFGPVLTNDTFIFVDIKTTTQFRVQVSTGGACPDSLSNVVTIGIGPAQAGTISGPNLVCEGLNNDTLWLMNNVGDSITWQSSPDSALWNNTGSDTIFQPFSGLSQTTFFRVIVVNDTCGSDTSAGYKIQVIPQTVAGMIIGDTGLCFNDTNMKNLILTGTVGNILFWESRDTGTAWVNIPITSDTLKYQKLEFPTDYRVIVGNSVCPNDTAIVSVSIDSLAIAGNLTGQDTICAGGNGVVFTTGSRGTLYNWERSINGGANWMPSASVDTFFNYSNITDTTIFRVLVTNGGCPADTSDTVAVLVKPAAIGGNILSDTAYCEGPNAGILTLTGHTGNIIDWEFSVNGTSYTSTGNTLPTLAYNNVTQTTFYRAILGLGDCPNDTSDTASITIHPAPVVAITPDGPLEFCDGGNVVLTASGGPVYSWNTGETDSAITISTSGTYSVQVTDTTSSVNCQNTDSVEVIVHQLPVIIAQTDTTIPLGSSVMLSASGGLTYVWAPTTGLDNPISATPVASPSETIIYLLTGTDVNGCIGVDSVTVTIDDSADPEFINLFTPDGDGINDAWVLDCNNCRLNVYNRYGQEVFSSTSYQNDWEGTFEGKKLPDGTYYFVLQSDNTGKTYKGAVTILRGE